MKKSHFLALKRIELIVVLHLYNHLIKLLIIQLLSYLMLKYKNKTKYIIISIGEKGKFSKENKYGWFIMLIKCFFNVLISIKVLWLVWSISSNTSCQISFGWNDAQTSLSNQWSPTVPTFSNFLLCFTFSNTRFLKIKWNFLFVFFFILLDLCFDF